MDRIPFFRRAVLARRPAAASLALATVAVAVATAARWFVDKGASGIPFVTFFPAVLLATVFLGWRYGAFTAAVSAIVANRLLREDPILFYLSAEDALVVFLFGLSCAVIIWSGETLRRMVHQQDEARRREELLKAELIHRVRNLFAVVQSIGTQTFRHSEPGEFLDKFNGRLLALERANRLLSDTPDGPCDLRQLVEGSVEAFNNGNFAVSGPSAQIPPASIVPLSLAFHELCTNAVKYGALGAEQGLVTVSWSNPDAAGELPIVWQETGGPKVGKPKRKGLGTALLRQQRGLKRIEVEFIETGLKCALVVDQAGPHR